jgi:hypothetical protein
MLAGIRSRLTFANVIALIALFIALGAGAYAAFDLPKNSVKSKHIVNGQVKKRDLGVPLKSVSAGLEPGPCQPNESVWRDGVSVGYNGPVGYYRDPFGIVHLQGTLLRCGDRVGGDYAFQLPPGYRTARDADSRVRELGVKGANVPEYVFIEGANVSIGDGVKDGDAFSLEGISFRCGPRGQHGCP